MKLTWEVKDVIKKELDITDWSEAAIAAYEDELQKIWKNKVTVFRIKQQPRGCSFLIGENDKQDIQ